VADFVKGLARAQAVADEVLSQKAPKVVPLHFNDGAKLLAIDEQNTMEKFAQIYAREDFKAIVFGLYDAYDTRISDGEANALVAQVEKDAKVVCLRYKCAEEKKSAVESRKSAVQLPARVSIVKDSAAAADASSPVAVGDVDLRLIEQWKTNALMGSVKGLEVPSAPAGDDQVEEMDDTDDESGGKEAEQPPVVIDAAAVVQNVQGDLRKLNGEAEKNTAVEGRQDEAKLVAAKANDSQAANIEQPRPVAKPDTLAEIQTPSKGLGAAQ
jgi:hypothetical protein